MSVLRIQFRLQRNFLFAASLAERDGHDEHYMLTIAPAVFADHLQRQLDIFKRDVLLPDQSVRVGFVSYENLARALSRRPYQENLDLSDFLLERLETVAG